MAVLFSFKTFINAFLLLPDDMRFVECFAFQIFIAPDPSVENLKMMSQYPNVPRFPKPNHLPRVSITGSPNDLILQTNSF